MRGRYLAAALILALVIGGAWEGKRLFFSPSIPTPAPSPVTPLPEIPETPPVPVPPPVVPSKPAPVKKEIPQKTTAPKKQPAAPHPSPGAAKTPAYPSTPVPPPVRYVPPPPPPQEWMGNSDSSITHPGQIVVVNDEQWNHFWAEHHPHEVSPEVDFSRSMVVGVFLGQRPADGFSVQIMGVRTLSDAVMVDYIERAPPPGTFQVSVEAYPYHLKVIPRSKLHVKFNKLTAQYLPDTSIIRSTGTKP